MTAVPIHTPVPTPNAPSRTSNPSPSGPQAPGSPQADPGTSDKPEPEPQTDSLDDIRNDLDHEPGGLTEPDPQDQQLLANAVPQNPDGTPQRFPDPFGPWSQLQNDGGNEVPGRSNNCADCSRSFLETWRGNPQVSAPRTLDTDENGNLDPWSPESDANENQIRWSGASHSYAGEGSDPDTAQRIADDLLQAGHGAHAIVQVDWPGGGGHAFNAVNHNGEVVWIDTQSGEVSHDPLHIANAEHVWHIPMDPDGNPLHPAETEDADDPQHPNDKAQTESSANAESSDSNGQPDSNTQNDASGDTPKQQIGSDDPSTEAPTATDSATPDASNTSNTSQPSATEPSTAPDSANGKAENEDGRQTSPDNGNSTQPRQSETPESASEQNRTSPSETHDTRDQQPRPDTPTRSHEQGGAPDRESQAPTPTAASPARTDSPSEHRQQPTHTTPDDRSTPTRTTMDTPANRPAQNTPGEATPNRETPQQTTTPSDPRTSIPHQQTADPRTTAPRRDNPTQEKPEAGERPDGRRPNTPPRADETHPDQTRPDQTRPDHREGSQSEDSGKTRPDTQDQSSADASRDRPSNMNKDSAVRTRESLPDGRNANAASYLKDSLNNKKPLYGDIAPENAAQTTRSTSPERPSGPAEPAGSTPDANDQASRRQRDLDMLARANSKDPKDRAWFEKYYHPKSGYRRSVTAPAEDGRPVPQLHPTNDPNAPWMLANDAPDADPETYIDEGAATGARDEEISKENQDRLDEAAKARQQAIDADRQPHIDRQAAKEAYEADKTEENRKKFEDADAEHSPLHGKMTRASEDYGEEVAEFHAMPRHFPDHTRIDDRATGNNRFDQIWVDPSADPPEFVVVEAKGSLKAGLGERRGLPEHDGSGPSTEPDNSSSQGQVDSDQNDQNDESGQDAPTPGVPKVRQGTRAYFETILHEMEERARRNNFKAKTDAEREAAEAERQLARDLRKALNANPSRVTYILVKGNSSGGQHEGYEMKQFDIRTEAEKQNDADSAT